MEYRYAREDPYAAGWDNGYAAALADIKVQAERVDINTYRVVAAIADQLRRRHGTDQLVGGHR